MNTLGTLLVWLAILSAIFVPYLNHIYYCFTQHEYVLLLVGVIIAPLGWIHGLGNLIGIW